MTFLKTGCRLCKGKLWHLDGCDGKKYEGVGVKKDRRRGPDESLLAEYGVAKIEQTASGREYMAALRSKHEVDLLQPSDPRFKQYYGTQHKRIEADKREQAAQAKREWQRSPGYQAQKERERKIAMDGV